MVTRETDNSSAGNMWPWIGEYVTMDGWVPDGRPSYIRPLLQSSEHTGRKGGETAGARGGKGCCQTTSSEHESCCTHGLTPLCSLIRPAQDQNREQGSSNSKGFMRSISNWELLSGNDCWGTEDQFSLGGCPGSRGWSYTHVHETHLTGLSQGVIKKVIKKGGRECEVEKGMCQVSW